MKDLYVVSCCRTAVGSFGGSLKDVPATDLGAIVVKEALKRARLEPMALSSKEGLALVSGTTSATAMAALALFDLLNAAKSADIVGAMSLEAFAGLVGGECASKAIL